VIRQRAFLEERVIDWSGGGHGGDLRAENENASDEGMKSSHKGLLIYQKTSNAQHPTSNAEFELEMRRDGAHPSK